MEVHKERDAPLLEKEALISAFSIMRDRFKEVSTIDLTRFDVEVTEEVPQGSGILGAKRSPQGKVTLLLFYQNYINRFDPYKGAKLDVGVHTMGMGMFALGFSFSGLSDTYSNLVREPNDINTIVKWVAQTAAYERLIGAMVNYELVGNGEDWNTFSKRYFNEIIEITLKELRNTVPDVLKESGIEDAVKQINEHPETQINLGEYWVVEKDDPRINEKVEGLYTTLLGNVTALEFSTAGIDDIKEAMAEYFGTLFTIKSALRDGGEDDDESGPLQWPHGPVKKDFTGYN